MSQKIFSAERGAAIIIFALVIVAGVYRLFMGVSIADEAQYVAFADFPRIGARWFADESTIQQTSAILMSPFVSAYTALFGTEAVFLYSRLLYLLSAVGTALVSARFFARIMDANVALVLAATVVAYVPFGMAVLNYNSMGSQYFALAAMLTLLGVLERRPRLVTGGAVFWVFCVFSYPTAMLTFILFTAVTLVWFRREADLWRSFVKPYAVGLVIPSVVLGGVLVWCGVDNIISAVRLSQPANMPFQPFKIAFGLKLLGSYLPPWWTLAVSFSVWLFLHLRWPEYSFAGIGLFLLAYVFLGAESEKQQGPVMWALFQALLPLVVWARWKKMSPAARAAVVCLAIPAMAGTVVSWMTSRMTVYNMHGTGIHATLATLALASGRNRMAGWFFSLLVLGATLAYQFRAPYEDDLYPKLTHRVAEGPYRFLYTNPRKGETIEAVQRDLKQLPSHGSILFKDHFPAGVLMTSLKPVGPTINILPAFIHPEFRPIYREIFQNRAYFTDFIVEFRYFPVSSENWFYMSADIENPKEDLFRWDPFHNFFMKSGEYRVVVDRGVYRILQRARP